MANEGIHAIVYPDGVISQSAEGIMFSCEDPVWILIPTQICLQELKSLILMNLGQLGRKEITRLLYRMPVAVANSFVYQKMQIRSDTNVSMMFSYHHGIACVFAVELCVQLEDVGASSSSSNHVEPWGGGFNINEGARMPSNRRASSPSPSFSPYVNRTVHAPPPDVPHFEEHDGGIMMHSPEIDDLHAMGVNSDSGEDEEFIPETQP
ncbi:hypothetical protein PIB30_099445 [Stylosanthes scabra]|uniref:Uncharacterized protein n=1 Tax=Stylosanthes scabra TaxID=79078 RepID=A0ABU6RXT3_9FABA|nr:hypothetical protein [Stylosanthes scabra]